MTTVGEDVRGASVQVLRDGTTQTVSVSGTSVATTNGFGTYARVVRVVSTTACYRKVGNSPTATSSDVYMPADLVEYVSVKPGEKIAFIQVSGSGTAFVTEMK